MKNKRFEIKDISVDQAVEKAAGKPSDMFVNVLTLGALSAAKRAARRYLLNNEEAWEDKAGLRRNEKGVEYGICFGYAVKRHGKAERNKAGIYATKADGGRGNVIAPILLDDEQLRQHVQIIGTTGSGKTQLIKGVLEQQIARGGGAFAVFGKADNVMLQQLYAVAVEYGRDQDFFVVDWTATKEQSADSSRLSGATILTNAINIFDLGTPDDVVNAMIKVAGLDRGGDKWEAAAKDYLAAVLRLMGRMREAGIIFNFDMMDDILEAEDTLSAAREAHENLSFYTLSELISSSEKVFKLILVIEKIYQNNRHEFEEMLFAKLESIRYAESSARDDIHLELKKVINTQINGITVDTVLRMIEEDVIAGYNGIKKNEKTFYKLEVSQSQLGTLITFFNKFGLILKNKLSDFDFLEAFRSGKVVIFNVPGQEGEEARIIGKMVMAVLNLLIKKQGRAPKTDQTFLGIFDEINSWAKGSEDDPFGLGNVLSVVRGLGIAGIISHQSSLDSMGKGTSEREQVQANVNTKIILKTESSQIIEELNTLVGKKEYKYKKDKVKNEKSVSDDDAEIVERDIFDKETLGSLWAGQGYFIRHRVVESMITYYLPNKRYSALDEETIPITKIVELNEVRKLVGQHPF